MGPAQVLGGRHEGRRQEGGLGSARAHAGGDGNARHRQHCLLLAVKPSLRGAHATNQSSFLSVASWIASRSLSSGARSRDPLARNDEQLQTALLISSLRNKERGGRRTAQTAM